MGGVGENNADSLFYSQWQVWNIWGQLDPGRVGATRRATVWVSQGGVRLFHSSSVMRCHVGTRERERSIQLGIEGKPLHYPLLIDRKTEAQRDLIGNVRT